MDYDGNILWDKSYGEKLSYDWCLIVENTFDNNYIITGATNGGFLGLGIWGTDIWIMKVDNLGSIIWQKHKGLPYFKDYSMSIKSTRDGGYVYTGHIFGLGLMGDPAFGSWSKPILVKTDSEGNILWQKILQDNGHSMTIRETDDGFILCGFQKGDKGLSSDYGWVLKTDKNGEI